MPGYIPSRASQAIYIERDVILSPAYRAAAVGKAHFVYSLLLIRRVMQFDKPTKDWRVLNNGKIEFTYAEAAKKFGLQKGAFRRAVDKLEAVGLIDVERGGGLQRDKSMFSFSERWRAYDTTEFEEVERRRAVKKGYLGQGLGVAAKAANKRSRPKTTGRLVDATTTGSKRRADVLV